MRVWMDGPARLSSGSAVSVAQLVAGTLSVRALKAEDPAR
jgi:hypothetical protein